MDSAGRSFGALLGAFSLVAGCGICAAAGLALGAVSLFGVATVLISGAAIARVALAVRRSLIAERGLHEALLGESLPPPRRLVNAAAAAGLAGRVSLLDRDEPCCFVHGALAPRVAISRGLLARLIDGELRAVLEHERYHVGAVDPLKGMIGGAIVSALLWAPPLPTLFRRYEASRELAADRRAARRWGRRDLAGALLKSVSAGAPPAAGAVPFGGPASILGARLEQIEAGSEGDVAVAPVGRLSTAIALAAPVALAVAFGGAFAICVVPLMAAAALTVAVFGRRALRPL